MPSKEWKHSHFRDGASPDYWNQLSSSEDGIRASRVIPKASRRLAAQYATDFDDMAEFIFSALGQNDSILDVGCGAGEMYARLPRGFTGTYHGIDFSRGMLDLFEREKPVRQHRELHCCSLDELQPTPGAYDLVMSIGVYFYVHPDDRAAFIANMAARLRPGGQLIIDFVNEDYRFAELTGNRLTIGELEGHLHAQGLEAKRVAGFFTLGHLFKRPWLLWNRVERVLRRVGLLRNKEVVRKWGYRMVVIAQVRT